MYKYKKTIIINNRRRRIFSKEKSNTEYILYKKEYITLNAYNKKTGGSGLGGIYTYTTNFIHRKISQARGNAEINDFNIPFSKFTNINDSKTYLNKYNKNISDEISKYLKDKGMIASKINKKWIITSIEDTKYIKVTGVNEIHEFEIPSAIINKSSIFDTDGISIGINNYNKNISDGISKYLQDNSEIDEKTEKKFWIITDYNYRNMKVHGYTTYEWDQIVNDRNTTEKLIEYGIAMHEHRLHYYYTVYCNIEEIDKNKIKKYISNINLEPKEQGYLFYNYLVNEKGRDIYMKLKKNYFIYLTIFKNTNTDYKVDNQYKLLDTYFTCIKVSYKDNNNNGVNGYLIVFRFDGVII